MDRRQSFCIEIDGREYPVRMVMGALLMYKRETGRDASEMDPTDMESLLMLLYCCAVCASRAERIDFPYSFEQFCDLITPQDVTAWNRAMEAEQAAGGGAEKKTAAVL